MDINRLPIRFLGALLILPITSVIISAHGSVKFNPSEHQERAIEFPDTEEYLTLSLDPHTHSVFSDGHVWPTIRVEEALRDGLDAIAITEHLEYQPHHQDIPHDDRNRSWEHANASVKGDEILVVHGSEITRSQPVGHLNAIFLSDSNALLNKPTNIANEDNEAYRKAVRNWPAEKALAAAAEQNAFVFLNHLDWTSQQPSGIAKLTEFHLQMIDQGLIHGVEVANTHNYSEHSFAIALEHNLAILGSSDIHGLIDWDYPPEKGIHRPVTLVLAEDRTQQGLLNALVARRSVAWHNNLLLGREAHVRPIVEASISIRSAHYLGKTQVLSVQIHNNSDARYLLFNDSDYTFTRHGEVIELTPHKTTTIEIRTGTRLEKFELPTSVLNVLVEPKTPLQFVLSVPVSEPLSTD